jgi:protein-S-isoprenylcysteine O-methyltransferase Ste14
MSPASVALVALQFGLLGLIILSTRWEASPNAWPPAIFLFAIGVVLGLWTLGHNRLGNFNIRPEVKESARLVTSGPYRFVRHPMYAAPLLGMAAFVCVDPRAWRIGALAALMLVLIAKARREERLLGARFIDYPLYAARTRRFVPFVY